MTLSIIPVVIWNSFELLFDNNYLLSNYLFFHIFVCKSFSLNFEEICKKQNNTNPIFIYKVKQNHNLNCERSF